MSVVTDLVPGGGSHLVFCSRQQVGWTSLLVRRLADDPVVEDLALAPTDAQHLVLMTAGRKSIESCSDGRWRRASYAPGRIGMTAPGRPTRLRWRSTSDASIETLHVYLPGEAVRRTAREVWGDDRTTQLADRLSVADPVLEQTMLGLAVAAESAAPDLYAESAAVFLAVHLLLRHGGRPMPSGRGPEDVRIERAAHYMRDNLRLPLTLADIAGEAGLSPYHFLRLFKAARGRTPLRYLIDLRIALGRRYLERSTLSVSDIAHRCGFASGAHFSTVFRHRVGTSPSVYRSSHRG